MSAFVTNRVLRLRYYCRALRVIAGQHIEDPETRALRLIIVASILRHDHGQQIVVIPLAFSYNYDTILIQLMNHECQEHGEPIRLSILNGMPDGTVNGARSRRRSM
jgi:hypothetical protein